MSHSKRHLAPIYLLGLVALIASATFALLLDADANGVFFSSPRALWNALTGQGVEHEVITQFRLPRILAAGVIGIGLAGAGTAFQAALRNPLAEPYTLGISSGSALAAVIAIRLGVDNILGTYGIGIAALIGSLVTIYIVWRLSRVHDRLPAATLLLAGIAIAMFASAATLAIQYTADLSQIYRMVRWMMGGLAGVSGWPLMVASLGIITMSIGLIGIAKDLNALSAGHDTAASVGVHPYRVTTIAFVLSSIVVGLGIALAGPIGFVGLIVPHTLRFVVGPDHRRLMPAAMVGGGVLLILCDSLARTLLYPAELPVGVITALLGGPFFLRLLLREKKGGRLWA